LDNAFEGVALMDLTTNRVTYLNPTLCNWLDRPQVEADGVSVTEVLDLSSAGTSAREADLRSLAMSPSVAHFAWLLVGGKPHSRVEVRFCRLPGNGPPYLGICVSKAAFEPANTAEPAPLRRDPLTGLHDRAFLISRLAALLAGDRSADQQFVVLFVDVDGFKRVNDAYGHLVGDGVLREVACRLKSCVREHDQVVRFGGDEFVVLAERISASTDIQPIIDRIHAILEDPITLPDGETTLTVSIGVTEASPDHRSPDDVLAAADRAMYASKRLTG
jgi:diguanylate cyclase (GGDEF)-like protein